MTKSALICVDVQNDFLPGGALGVDRGDEVVDPLLRASESVDLVAATRDWHPKDHLSFAEQGGPWPPHCLQNDSGAEIDPKITAIADVVISKATEPDQEAYSGFQGTALAKWLREHNVETVLIGGLATDYCVKATALDAAEEGFDVFLLSDATRAVDPDQEQAVVEELVAQGVKATTVERLNESA
jgi:nicotinamidase/pyrazinamidase